MTPVWHLALDFKVKPLDPELGCRVYKRGGTLPDGPAAGFSKDDAMKRKLIALFSTAFAVLTTQALAATTRVAANGGGCPPCPFCR